MLIGLYKYALVNLESALKVYELLNNQSAVMMTNLMSCACAEEVESVNKNKKR